MNAYRAWVPSLLLVLIITTCLSSANVVASTEPDWIRVQDSAHGYAVNCPPEAIVKRFDPEGVLHILLPSVRRLLTIHTQPNVDGLSAAQWTDAWLSGQLPNNPDGFGPPPRQISRASTIIAGQIAEEVTWNGWEELRRRVIIADKNGIYLIDHPLPGGSTNVVFDRIVATFTVGNVAVDTGFRIMAADSIDSIASLDVPYYSQRSEPWKCNQYGTCTTVASWDTCPQTYTTIEAAGCHIASQAMILAYYAGGQWMDPLELDTCLTTHSQYGYLSSWGGYCGAPSYSSACMPASVAYLGWLYMSEAQAVLDADLAAGHPAIGRRLDDEHSVAIIGKSGGNYVIHDPWQGRDLVVGAGWFYYFWRYHGPVPQPACCGCSAAPANKMSSASATATRSVSSQVVSSDRLSVRWPQVASQPIITAQPSLPAAPKIPFADIMAAVPATVSDAPIAPPQSKEPVAAVARAPVDPLRVPPASASYAIPKSVFGSGGGLKTSVSYRLQGTSGQTTGTGSLISAGYRLHSGYWAARPPRWASSRQPRISVWMERV